MLKLKVNKGHLCYAHFLMYGGHVLNIVKTFSIDLSVIESTRIYACIIGYSQFAGPMFGKLSLQVGRSHYEKRPAL